MKIRSILLICILSIVASACDSDEVAVTSDNKTEQVLLEEGDVIKRLTADMGSIALGYSDVNCSTRSWKSFWRKVAQIFYNDACGYSWGRQHGLSWQLSLGCGAVASVVTAVNTTAVNVSVSNEVIAYPKMTMAEQIGQAHNKVIAAVVVDDVQKIDVSEQLVSDVNSEAIVAIDLPVSLKMRGDLTVSGFNPDWEIMSEVVEEELNFAQIMGNVDDLDAAHRKAQSFATNTSFCDNLDFLKEYVSNIIEIGDKSQIRLFTDEVSKSIDDAGLGLQRALDLKAMIAIAENSYSLWIIEEK